MKKLPLSVTLEDEDQGMTKAEQIERFRRETSTDHRDGSSITREHRPVTREAKPIPRKRPPRRNEVEE